VNVAVPMRIGREVGNKKKTIFLVQIARERQQEDCGLVVRLYWVK